MAVAFRSLSALAYGSRTNSTVPAPSGVADGDILLLAFLIGSSGTPPTPTLPAGWTLLQGPATVMDSGFQVARRLLWKVASAEPASYAFSHASGSTCAVALAISGGDTATPVSSSNGRSIGDAAPPNITTALSVTTPAADSYVAFIVHNWALYGTASPPTGTTPTFTERQDAGDNLLYVADGILSGAAAATGDKSHNNLSSGAAGDAWGAFLVAIGPSGAAPAGQPYSKRTGGIPHLRLTRNQSIW